MKDSEGRRGARAEVVYSLVDAIGEGGKEKNIIGYKSSDDGATTDRMVYGGSELDLNASWETGERSAFSTPFGTATACNGAIFDSDCKTSTGGSTTGPVGDPETDTGQQIAIDGIIQLPLSCRTGSTF